MDNRLKYAQTRQQIIDMLRIDLIGPMDPNEVLDENPRHAYIMGMLASSIDVENELEVDGDVSYDGDTDYTEGQDDDNEPVTTTRFSIPTSFGISFYVESSTTSINLDITWGDYTRSYVNKTTSAGKSISVANYTRHPMKETITIKFDDFEKSNEYPLVQDSNVVVYVQKISLKKGYTLVTAYVINRRNNPESDVESLMFQVKLRAYREDNSKIFIAEHICRDVLEKDEFYYEQRPIMGRGRGCAAIWGEQLNGRTDYVESEFMPEYEIPGVSAALEGMDNFYFSMRFLGVPKKKEEIIQRLNVLADLYAKWIDEKLVNDVKMSNPEFKNEIGNSVIEKCVSSLERIREGIKLLVEDETAFEAFCFMNRAMILQRNIMNYARKHGSGVECSFTDFVDPRNPENNFGWRPFQIAFILLNINAIVNPLHSDRDIVDLLYFPTGGGKTEAYLGLMAFVIANRRLRAKEFDEFNLDGGVTAILRYTLRLLTTQQRDRITRMVIAAEMIRKKECPKFGETPITIGFWVGGAVTPNKFEDLKEDPDDKVKNDYARKQRNLIYKQLLHCPFCGKPLSEDEFRIDTEKKSVDIYCADKTCMYYKYNPKRDKDTKIPVYLVDEEIYAKCPTIILSTVDKFASLPWSVETNALFGRVDRKCERHGYVSIGSSHPGTHRASGILKAASVSPVKPFLPPELIIQDELHLITGPLGTVYGAYETLIENLCTYSSGNHVIKPKYIVSTATIKNADEQVKCLYARKSTSQFPSNGFEIGDSFFIKEIDIKDDPFRKYIGICAPGQSVKTALLRIYSVILQQSYNLSLDPAYVDFIDPYYTLVGYYNSIRELGGAVRLLQDDIPDRIYRIKNKYGMKSQRFLNYRTEITSRCSSSEIPKRLMQLETPYGQKGCLDTAVASNMIAVGMDVDRLANMVITGQPKQNSEYIQASSRIGRTYPGMVFTLYNAYRPRDLSHYENFTGYHSQLYRYVEGTTATPFSARARDRVMHAVVIGAIRLRYPEMASNESACQIEALTDEQIKEIKNIILERLNIVKPFARTDAENEIDAFISSWKMIAAQQKQLRYYVVKTDTYNRLMNNYGEYCTDTEKPTLRSMRDVENTSAMYYYEED